MLIQQIATECRRIGQLTNSVLYRSQYRSQNWSRAVQILRIDDFIENQIQNRKKYRKLGAIRRDSIPQPGDPEVTALPIELLPQFH